MTREEIIESMNGLVADHKRKVAEKLREVMDVINSEKDLYGGAGFPQILAQVYQASDHFSTQLVPPVEVPEAPQA